MKVLLMKVLLMPALAACLWAAPQDNDAKKDLEKLQGAWKMIALEVEGTQVPPEKFGKATLIIKADRYLLDAGKTKTEVMLTLDPSKTPKHVDLTFLDGPNKDQVGKAIYSIDGDTFKICRALLTEADRPRQFATAPKSGQYVVTWQRVPK
jgi:uncharacterized protein (TIGR03067 family)